MTNFDDFKKAAAETAGTVADKSIIFAKKVADKTKCVARMAVLRTEIANEQELLRKNFKELGKAYYNAHKDDPEPELAQLCTDVSVAAERIAARRTELDDLKEQLMKNDAAQDADYVCCAEADKPDKDEPAAEAPKAEEPAAEAPKAEEPAADCGCGCGCCSEPVEPAPAEEEKKDE